MNAKFIKSYYRTYNSEDPEALRKYYHEDVVLNSEEGCMEGVESILATYRYLIANFHDKMTPLYIELNDDTAVVNILDRLTAKQNVADFMGMSLATGDSFNLSLRATYQVIDGKFKRIHIERV